MNRQIAAGRRTGAIDVPSSKSVAHRTLICAALADGPCELECVGISKDIAATVSCLNSLGADIVIGENGSISVTPISGASSDVKYLSCGESGSTFRFLLPVACALGCTAVFKLEGRLSQRPIDALTDELEAHGVTITKKDDTLTVEGKLLPGEYSIPGNISSQFVSGLLFALPLLPGDSKLRVLGNIESADYITMTENAVRCAGITFEKNGNEYTVLGNSCYKPPKDRVIEPDWSNAAFFLCMGALSDRGVTVNEMPLTSGQGDKEILNILKNFGAEVKTDGKRITVKGGRLKGTTVDAAAIPDLVPTLSAVAAGAEGTTEIINAGRLRFKESDRLCTTAEMLRALGAEVEEKADGLVIRGKDMLDGGAVSAANDHRIAMAAAVASCICKNSVTVMGAECTDKSYPEFWNDLEKLEVYA